MEKTVYRVLGVMSGTSLDGVDLALLEFEKKDSWDFKIMKAETIPYGQEWGRKLGAAVSWSEPQLEELNEEYTQLLSGFINEFISRYQVQDLDAVCSHGHTIKHEPYNGFTLQIGNLPILAELIGHTLVCDFRVQDVKLGGQGAPLVPIGDQLLFPEFQFCLNLGGFANISTETGGKRIAYDICPVNTVLNHLSNHLNLSYDKNGKIADSGNLDRQLLERLNSLDYYVQPPPKSLGIEWVNKHILPMLKHREDIASLLHTYTVHAAEQIAKAFNNDADSKVLATGGGAFNNFLIKQIGTKTECQLYVPSPEVVNYKEALVFGLLGVLKLRGEVNILSSVTGASQNHSSGIIYQ